MISLLAVFRAAFLGSEGDFSERIWDSAGMLLVAAGIALLGGMLFLAGAGAKRRPEPHEAPGEFPLAAILETFPVRIFCWGTGLMAGLFLAAWYLETHCIFYKDVRF